MKVKPLFYIAWSKRINFWAFILLPTIFVTRQDVLASEAAYYIVIEWLMFQAGLRITKKKDESPNAS